jgi:hypothetical protein
MDDVRAGVSFFLGAKVRNVKDFEAGEHTGSRRGSLGRGKYVMFKSTISPRWHSRFLYLVATLYSRQHGLIKCGVWLCTSACLSEWGDGYTFAARCCHGPGKEEGCIEVCKDWARQWKIRQNAVALVWLHINVRTRHGWQSQSRLSPSTSPWAMISHRLMGQPFNVWPPGDYLYIRTQRCISTKPLACMLRQMVFHAFVISNIFCALS